MLKKLCAAFMALLLLTLASVSLAEEASSIAKTLIITEVMASNHTGLEDAFGRFPDWLEIYNTTDEAISLGGVFLSDKKNEPARYAFPADAMIQPHEYIIVFASGAKKDIADEYHTSFKLSALGEAIYLSRSDAILDAILFGFQETDIALALDANGTFVQTLTPTPGSANQITPVQ